MSESKALDPPKPGALVKAKPLTPAWEPDPPGPLSAAAVPERYLLPATTHAPRPELVVGICLGTAAAAPFILLQWPLFGFLATFIAVLGGARAFSGYRIKKWRAGMAEAFERLEAGDYDGAEETFRAVALRQRDPLLRSASADFGYLAIRRGDLATALAIYSRAWRSPVLTPEARHAISLNLAFCYAAMGDMASAENWFPEKTMLVGTPSSIAYIYARQERYQECLDLAMPDIDTWQQPFVKHERRLLYLMQAFSLAKTGEPDDLVAAHATIAQPAYPGEFRYLTDEWKELRNFIKDVVEPSMDNL